MARSVNEEGAERTTAVGGPRNLGRISGGPQCGKATRGGPQHAGNSGNRKCSKEMSGEFAEEKALDEDLSKGRTGRKRGAETKKRPRKSVLRMHTGTTKIRAGTQGKLKDTRIVTRYRVRRF